MFFFLFHRRHDCKDSLELEFYSNQHVALFCYNFMLTRKNLNKNNLEAANLFQLALMFTKVIQLIFN